MNLASGVVCLFVFRFYGRGVFLNQYHMDRQINYI